MPTYLISLFVQSITKYASFSHGRFCFNLGDSYFGVCSKEGRRSSTWCLCVRMHACAPSHPACSRRLESSSMTKRTIANDPTQARLPFKKVRRLADGSTQPIDEPPPSSAPGHKFACELCNLTFSRKQALAAHTSCDKTHLDRMKQQEKKEGLELARELEVAFTAGLP